MKSLLQTLWTPTGFLILGAILTTIGAVLAAQQKAAFERELRIKSDEIATLNKEIVKILRSDGSFCYLTIGNLDTNTNVGLLMVVHQGEYPIHNVNARLVDLQEFEKIKNKMNIYNFTQSDTNIPIGSMIKNTSSTLGRFDLGKSSNRDFNIFFSANNGLFTELLRLRKVDGKWLSAIKVQKEGKVIFEKIDSNFPRTNKGEIDWK
jgi:hypothetical protein